MTNLHHSAVPHRNVPPPHRLLSVETPPGNTARLRTLHASAGRSDGSRSSDRPPEVMPSSGIKPITERTNCMNQDQPEPVAAVTRALAGDDRTHYDPIVIALHWTTAVLVVLQFALAETWGFAERPVRHQMIVAHMSFGILLTAVILMRIAWRLMPGHQMPPAVSGWVEIASKAVHYLLYALLAVQAVLGFVLRWSGNEAMSFF